MYSEAIQLINGARRIVVIQAENPDGDSIGSALALEEILSDLGKEVTLYCPVDVPKYLRYISGWDRIIDDFDTRADIAIIVDTASNILLSKVLEKPEARNFLETHQVVVVDHHETESDLTFPHILATKQVVATSHVIYEITKEANWKINPQAAENLLIALMSDSLGLTTPNVTAETFFVAGELTKLGANNSDIEDRRREFMKKSPEILNYKADLIKKINYHLDGRLAIVHVPFDEIEKYSDQYNPGALIGDELRLVEGVDISCVIKTYPDGKLTGRLRSSIPVSENLAGFFGGGGHAYAAGFRIYESIDSLTPELVKAADDILRDYDKAI